MHRFSRDEGLRGKALSYRVIGAAMRGELLYPDPNILRRGIHKALDGDSSVAETVDVRRWSARRLARPMMGAAVAATVAVFAITGLRNVARNGNEGQVVPLATNLGKTEAATYVVPQDAVEAGVLRQVPIRLTNYLVNHGEYASGLGRKSIHSDIVGFRSGSDIDEDVGARESRE